MTLTWIDWGIIIGYFILALSVGLFFSKRAGKNLTEYFISGRSLPWWIAGTSMVATTFAADTPLAVTGLIADYGLAGNWFWWAFAMGGMFTVFVYAKLWRRAEVLTDVEMVELRYSGKPAAFLRGFRALYIAILVNSIIIGWVTGAMLKVLKYTVLSGTEMGAGHSDWVIILILLLVVGIYSTIAGMWGVAVTDVIQFIIAMGGCIFLAVVAVDHVGGMHELQVKVAANFPQGDQAFRFLPDFLSDHPWMPLSVFLIMMFVQWWASWYPGSEPGGGGYIVQRMASCKNEKHSVLATLWFQIANYCVRPWPWLLVAFVALAMYPNLKQMEDPGVGFPMIIRDLAPIGLRGLMIVAFFSAYMSTMSTQINWGASYLANDFYKRFIRPGASDRHLTFVSRLCSLFVLALGGVAAWIMKGISVDDAWKLLAALGAGSGAVFMLRWFWWRINAWTEISAMVASLAAYLIVQNYIETDEYRLAIVAVITIVVWLVVTYVTPPEKQETLMAFYRKVRPGGWGWRPIQRIAQDVHADRDLAPNILASICAGMIVYLTLPAIGFILFGAYLKSGLCFLGALFAAGLVAWLMKVAARRNA